jgi:hypothetical protein
VGGWITSNWILVGVDSVGLAHDGYKWRALVNVVMKIRVSLNVGKVLSGCITDDLSSTAQLNRVSYDIAFFRHTLITASVKILT